MKKESANLRAGAKTGQTMLGGAMILTLALMLVKVIGAIFKLPLANAVHMEGMGYFDNAYNIYLPIYAIAITGLPIAVSRMVSQRCTLGLYNDVKAIQKVAQRLFLLVGIAATLIMLAIIKPAVHFKLVASGSDAIPAMLAIAPTIFFCCAMSAYRGYYEGMRNMIPTATSQVIEAACKMVIGLALASFVMRTGLKEYAAEGTVFGNAAASEGAALSMLYPWAAAAAILGITVGSIVGLTYLWLRFRLKGDGITREMLVNAPPAQPRKSILREMVKFAIPMVISSSILNLTNLIDNFNVQYLLNKALEKYPDIIQGIYGNAFRLAQTQPDKYANYIWGVYSTSLTFRTLIPTIIAALGVSALPAISAAWTNRDKETVQKTVNTVLRMAMFIALPAGFGMAVLSKEIMTLFYEAKNPGMAVHAAPILMVFGLATALMAVSTPIISMLQGIGRTDIPVKSLVAGTVVKIGTNFLLVSRPEINVNGAVVGTVLFYAVIVSVNLFMLLRVSKTKVHAMSVLVKPLFCAGLSAAAAWLARDLVQRFMPRFNTNEDLILFFSAVAAIAFAVLIYAVSMLLCRAVTGEDLENLPMGNKLAKALAKYRLLG